MCGESHADLPPKEPTFLSRLRLSMPQEILSRKRPLEEETSDGSPAPKRRAVGHLNPVSQTQLPTVQWSNKFGSTCLFGTVGTSQSDGRVALFDLDQTLIDTKSGSKFPRDHKDWRWLSSKVPAKLNQLHAEGYTLFIISNQAHPRNVKKLEVYFAEWRRKIERVAHALQGVPFRILSATKPDEYRKPLPGMWYAITSILNAEGVAVNQEKAFYVGDAAGRNGRKRDHSASDRKFALNVGIQFYTPQEYFLGEAPLPFQLNGFRPLNIPDQPLYLPSNFRLVPPTTTKNPGIILFVGYPGMGKTTTYNKYFKPAGYAYVDRKSFQTESNCMKAIEDSIVAKKSVVVDGTNYNASTRDDYLRIGANLGVPVRCIVFDGDENWAWHNHVYRKYILKETVNATQQTERDFKNFRDAYQRPTAAEGFKDKILTIFWKFEGADEEHKKYMMWLDF